jgi:hypothetical protein
MSEERLHYGRRGPQRAGDGMDDSDVADTLDLKQIDQLHDVTLEFSKTSQELKKLTVGLVSTVPLLIFKLTDDQLDHAVFIAGSVIVASFWLVDAYAYYYQEKTRERMKDIGTALRRRHEIMDPFSGVGMPLDKRPAKERLRRSLFNPSQLLYALMATACVLLWIAFGVGWI